LPGLLTRVKFISGYYAVNFFFVISGFLITRLSVARWGKLGQVHIGRFYGMCAARILPCLLALLVVLSALDLAGATEFVIQGGGYGCWGGRVMNFISCTCWLCWG
jgi:peptidoglycan/LPS O-acetylase OafA/YrhL